jgi:hydroxymethylbilane synthase
MSQAQPPTPLIGPHGRELPLKIGTRASPLARVQARAFTELLVQSCPVLGTADLFEEVAIRTSGDKAQDVRLADIGGKGLFAKEIHEALLDGRVDVAVHSLKDLETRLPFGVALACVLPREDPRDVLILGAGGRQPSPDAPWDALPEGAVVGTSSVRRQAQLLHARPDLRITLLRGNVQTRLDKLQAGACDATMLALAGLRRLGLEDVADVILSPSDMLPSASQGIIGITVRAADRELIKVLSAIEEPATRAASIAERAMLDRLDGSCRTPIGAYARIRPDGRLELTGLVARADGSFLLRRTLDGSPDEPEALGLELGAALRADSPPDLFA